MKAYSIPELHQCDTRQTTAWPEPRQSVGGGEKKIQRKSNSVVTRHDIDVSQECRDWKEKEAVFGCPAHIAYAFGTAMRTTPMVKSATKPTKNA